jgi:hypothetical protein
VRIWLFSALYLTIRLGVSAQAASVPAARDLVFHDIRAYVTGYNTVPGQTDDTPCIAASGANICGRNDAVACPRRISLGTYLVIRGAFYVCEDRLAKKYDSRFDISCDKDTNCPGQVTGWADIKVFAGNLCRLQTMMPTPAAPAPPRRIATGLRPMQIFSGRLQEWRRV